MCAERWCPAGVRVNNVPAVWVSWGWSSLGEHSAQHMARSHLCLTVTPLTLSASYSPTINSNCPSFQLTLKIFPQRVILISDSLKLVKEMSRDSSRTTLPNVHSLQDVSFKVQAYGPMNCESELWTFGSRTQSSAICNTMMVIRCPFIQETSCWNVGCFVQWLDLNLFVLMTRRTHSRTHPPRWGHSLLLLSDRSPELYPAGRTRPDAALGVLHSEK